MEKSIILTVKKEAFPSSYVWFVDYFYIQHIKQKTLDIIFKKHLKLSPVKLLNSRGTYDTYGPVYYDFSAARADIRSGTTKQMHPQYPWSFSVWMPSW